MKRILTALVLLLVVAALLYAARRPIVLRVMERRLAQNITSDLIDELPDGLHVALCGAGSPLPDPQRSGPCVAVIAGKKMYIVDAGAGSSRVLSRSRLPQGDIAAVFLTHFHSDHIDGLGELLLQRWVNGAHEQPVPVYGPPGVDQVVDGIAQAYAQDRAYRVAHHGAAIVPPAGAGGSAATFPLPPQGQTHLVLQDGALRVEAFAVDHRPVAPAVGYRFEYEGRSAVVSGDTAKSATVQSVAQGADLLVHEALAPQLVDVMTRAAQRAGRANLEKITTDIIDYHTTPVEVAEIARDAEVRALLFYHIVPPLLIAPLREIFLEGVADMYDGPTAVGRDGTLVRMPAGSTTVDFEELL